jgi:hypothetical protein
MKIGIASPSLLIFALSVAFVSATAIWQQKRIFVSECNVEVVGLDGLPIENIRVSEIWNAYSFDLSGGADLRTDTQGRVRFQAQWQEHSVLLWMLKRVGTAINYGAHASKGVNAFINVSEPGLPSQAGGAYSCSDTACNIHPLSIRLVSSNKAVHRTLPEPKPAQN